jgi:hypothetical protein
LSLCPFKQGLIFSQLPGRARSSQVGHMLTWGCSHSYPGEQPSRLHFSLLRSCLRAEVLEEKGTEEEHMDCGSCWGNKTQDEQEKKTQLPSWGPRSLLPTFGWVLWAGEVLGPFKTEKRGEGKHSGTNLSPELRIVQRVQMQHAPGSMVVWGVFPFWAKFLEGRKRGSQLKNNGLFPSPQTQSLTSTSHDVKNWWCGMECGSSSRVPA